MDVNKMTQAMDKIINNKPKQLTPDEAAAIVGVSKQTMAAWRCTKKENIPYYKIDGKVFYREQDLIDWMDKKRVAA